MDYGKSLEEEEKVTAGQIEIKNVGKVALNQQRGAVSRRNARHDRVQITGFYDLIPFLPHRPRILPDTKQLERIFGEDLLMKVDSCSVLPV